MTDVEQAAPAVAVSRRGSRGTAYVLRAAGPYASSSSR
jgi:hypothetical protein